MENNTGRPIVNRHSNVARVIVNQLIIGRLSDNTPSFEARVINRV
jgi:hypothetical protein